MKDFTFAEYMVLNDTIQDSLFSNAYNAPLLILKNIYTYISFIYLYYKVQIVCLSVCLSVIHT